MPARRLAKIDDREALANYLGERQEQDFFISRFVDYSDGDGLFRKCRIVFVDGRPYACHMAIADRWDIWYLNAGMPHSAGKRLEEETFMRTFDIGFARRHASALLGLAERIGLDYFIVDCAETRDGSLLVFEADNTAIVHDMDPPDVVSLQAAADAQDIRCFRCHARASQPGTAGACRMTIVLREGLLKSESSETLDPQNWDEIRAQGHRMLDDMLDYIADIRERPVWSPIPADVRARFRAELPRGPSSVADVYRDFTECVVPYATGNVHPGFMGWVHGGGSAVGMLAEMLAAGLNANLGGRDHMPIEVERQVVEWTRSMFGFPAEASGIFVTGTSMANLMAVLVARTSALGQSARQHGIGHDGAMLTAYTSKAAHGCIAKAMDISGLGSNALRSIAVDESHRIDVAGVARADRGRSRSGPEAVSGCRFRRQRWISAPLTISQRSARCAGKSNCGFMLTAPMVRSGFFRRRWRHGSLEIEAADSIALDFHKWGQVPL